MEMQVWVIEAKFQHQEQSDMRLSLTKNYHCARVEDAIHKFYEDLDQTGLQEELNLLELTTTSDVVPVVEFSDSVAA